MILGGPMKKYYLMLLAIITLLSSTACSGKFDINLGSKKDDGIYPFTGLEVTEESNHRAVAVMINNQKEARPQSGLHEADLVFEMLAEGNTTRFLALYQSALPEKVGPIRSAREYYVNLAKDYDAIYVYHGAAKHINEFIQNSGVDFLNGQQYDDDKELFIRETFRVAPHNSYLLFDEVYHKAGEKEYEVEGNHRGFTFIDDDEVTGIESNYVKIQYYDSSPTVEYEYDEAKGVYHRISDGVVTKDLERDAPVEIDNVFIIEADHEIIDDEGRRDIDLKAGGFGYLLQKGKVKKVEWINDKGYILPAKKGEIIPFVKGKTWINVVQTNPPENVEQVQIPEYNE